MGFFSDDTDAGDEAGLVADARSESVTSELLNEPKGGLTTHNLGHAPILDFLADDEQPHFLLLNATKGVRVHTDRDEAHVKPTGRRRAFVVVTDRRLLYLIGADDVETLEIPFEEIAAFDVRSGRTKHRLLLRTTSMLADFPVSVTNLGSDDVSALNTFLEDQTNVTAPQWTDEETERSKLSSTGENVLPEFGDFGPDGDVPSSSDQTADSGSTPGDVREAGESDPAPAPDETGSDQEPDSETGRDSDGDEPLASATNFADYTVDVYEDRVEISREGGVLKNETEKQFLYDGLNGVEFLKAKGKVRKGYVYFNRYGGDDADNAAEKVHSHDAVNFTKKSNEAFRKVKEAVQEHIRAHQSAGRQGTSSESSSDDPAIQKLREQYATGEITEEEYEQRLDVLTED